MAMTISIDDTLKDEFSSVCKDIGLSPSAAFCVFAKTVVREKAIPFELTSVARSERKLPSEIRDAIENSYRSYVEGPTFNLDDVDLMRANLAQNRNAS